MSSTQFSLPRGACRYTNCPCTEYFLSPEPPHLCGCCSHHPGYHVSFQLYSLLTLGLLIHLIHPADSFFCINNANSCCFQPQLGSEFDNYAGSLRSQSWFFNGSDSGGDSAISSL